MVEPEKIQPRLQFLTCPKCIGKGVLNKKTCQECHGIGIMAWTGNILLYWSKKINFLQITQEKLEELVKKLINLSLLLFGFFGLLMLAWAVYIIIELKVPLNQIIHFNTWQLFIFWCSILTDFYFLYRFQREIEKTKHIPKKKYTESPAISKPITWAEAKSIPKNKKIDITMYFTKDAQKTISKAWEISDKYKDVETNPIHLLISLLTFEKTRIIFSRLGASFATLRNKIGRVLAKQPSNLDVQINISVKVKEIIFQSYFIAYQLKQKKVEVTELLESLASQDNEVKEMLHDIDINLDKIKNVIAWLRIRQQLKDNWERFRHRASLRSKKSTMNRSMTAIATPVLDAFSQDMTLLARNGYFMPCVGRKKEIEDIFNIMHGGTRRSVILIGNPGVGKNTVIEGIAQQMVEEDVPDFMKDKRLVSLNIAKLVSGADPSEVQNRLMMALNEVRRSANIILYISDIHTMTGITAGRQGSIDVADVLAKSLASKSVLALSTATPSDYHRYIEGKSSLDNAMERVNIKEVSGNEAIQILESKVGLIEHKNQVFFSYDAIAETVSLSSRYLHDRYLPEKAIEILQEVASRVKDSKGKDSIISANDVALMISEKTNIPLAQITKEESEKLLNLEDKIHERMVNQEEAVKMVASSLRRARAEMRDMARPIVNLLFLGPTGVGKTELAKTVAQVYFGDEQNMIRLDMSEYQDKSSINRLIGAPAGHAGNTDGGHLSEAVRKNPFSLVLLDEIEKAHPDILNIFLQIMDDGRLTDTNGKTIDFTNAIIIATSNAGTRYIQEMVKRQVPITKIKEQLMNEKLGEYFRPELLNRFDGIIVFTPLSMQNVKDIAKLMLKKVAKSLESRGITLKATEEAVAELAQAGFNPEFGARPLRRVIQQRVQNSLANQLLAGKIDRRDIVTIQAGGQLVVTKAKKI